MRHLQPVLWTKGVLLTPQHLQAQDRFLEDAFQFQLSSLTFAPWGFHQLVVDREALAGGAVALTRAGGIFPDGLLFDMPEADPLPAPRPLEALWPPDQPSLLVYLAIPEYRFGGVNIAGAQEERDARYRSEVMMRRDENTGLAERPVLVGQKNFRLLVEGESSNGLSTMPVARVVRAPSGEVTLDARFVPPVIDIRASELLLSVTRRLVEILSAKSTQLAGKRRQRNQSLAEFGIADVASFWLLYTVNTHLPVIRHLMETRGGHPAELFGAMLELAGALTTFSSDLHPRDLPVYDHADLSRCVGDLDEKVRRLLETVVPANYVSVPLKLTAPAVYVGAIDQDRYLRATDWYLAVNAEMRQDELARRIPQLVKVSSSDRVGQLIKQALPGLALTHMATPPSAVPVKLGYQYFRLARAGADWDGVTRGRNLAAYVPADFPNPQVELVITLPREE
jgi:type VI secretion system protein ImpJ